MSKKAKISDNAELIVTGDKASEGFYVTVNNDIWPLNAVIYKSYGGELNAFGYGHLTKEQGTKKVALRRIPDDIEIIVGNGRN